MADEFTVRTNLPDFKRQLSAIGVKIEKEIVKGASFATSKVFQKFIRNEAPVAKRAHSGQAPPGTLKRAIYIYRQRDPKAGTVAYSISFRKGKKQQAVMVRRATGPKTKRVKGVKSARRPTTKVAINRDAFYGRFLELGWYPRKPGQAIGRFLTSARLARAGRNTIKLGVRRRSQERARNAAAGAKKYQYKFIEPGFNKAIEEATNVFIREFDAGLKRANAFVGPVRP